MRVVTDARLQDRYDWTDDIAGQGLTGVVRIVVDRVTKQRRVLKSLHYEGKSKNDRDALLNEMDVYLKLDHPNICRLLEVYADESTCHLVMELCTGGDLCERWEARGRYTEQDTREVISQMLAAVSYLHNKGIAHRDLKLENWVYADSSEDARLKLIDFGFSELVNPDTQMTAILGTIFYVAPEVLEQGYDLKCDMWSLGVIAHMLLSGVPPFGTFEDDDEAIFAKILDGGDAKMDGPEWWDISEEARDFVARLLTRDPSLRASAQEASEHAWLQAGLSSKRVAKEIDVTVLETLRSFASMNVIKRTACGLIAASMSVYETDELEAQFKKLDTQKRGTISMNELVDALKEHLGMSEEDAKELFSRIDLACDGRINYSEFLAATAQRRYMGQENSIKAAFDRFDTDKSGFISTENLTEVLGHSYMGLKPQDIIGQISDNGENVIRYEGFLKAMMDLGCRDVGNPLPGSTARMQNVSRALDFMSEEMCLPGSSPKAQRKSSCPSLNRGYYTPDELDVAPQLVDATDELPHCSFRIVSVAEQMEAEREVSTRSPSVASPVVQSPAALRCGTRSMDTSLRGQLQDTSAFARGPSTPSLSRGSSNGIPCSQEPQTAGDLRLAQLLSESLHVSDKE